MSIFCVFPEHLALSDPVIADGPDYYYLSREERYSEALRKYTHMIKKIKEFNLTDQMEIATYSGLASFTILLGYELLPFTKLLRTYYVACASLCSFTVISKCMCTMF